MNLGLVCQVHARYACPQCVPIANIFCTVTFLDPRLRSTVASDNQKLISARQCRSRLCLNNKGLVLRGGQKKALLQVVLACRCLHDD